MCLQLVREPRLVKGLWSCGRLAAALCIQVGSIIARQGRSELRWRKLCLLVLNIVPAMLIQPYALIKVCLRTSALHRFDNSC